MEDITLSYFILASHRSGSSLLCHLLAHTGVAGNPGEFFQHWWGSAHQNWPIDDYPAYVRRVINATRSDNGVFGVKFMSGPIGGIEGMVARLRQEKSLATIPLNDLLLTFFPNLKVIYLMRRNKIEQAMSWWKAVQNDQYYLEEDMSSSQMPVKYERHPIEVLLQVVIMEDCAHQEFLDYLSIKPHVVVYEDLLKDRQGTILGILDFLGIQEKPQPPKKPSLLKQADALSGEWVERFRQECQQANGDNPRWSDWLRHEAKLEPEKPS